MYLSATEHYYVAARDLGEAREKAKTQSNKFWTAQGAYDSLGYFDTRDFDYEVYQFHVDTEIKEIQPPYTER